MKLKPKYHFFQENDFGNAVCKTVAICSGMNVLLSYAEAIDHYCTAAGSISQNNY